MRDGIGLHPGADETMRSHEIVRSADMDAVHRSATAVMNTHAMRLLGHRDGAVAEISQSAVGGLRLLGFSYHCGVEIRPEPLEDFVAVHLPCRGGFVHSRNGRSFRVGPGSGAVISPADRVCMRWSEQLELRVLRVDLTSLERRLQALVGTRVTRPVDFEPVFGGATAAMLTHVVHAFQLAVEGEPQAPSTAVLVREIEDLVVSTLLLGLVHSNSDVLATPTGATSARTVRRVVDYCRDHHSEPLGAEELARIASVSQRTLFAAFRREFDTTPARWLRRLRLERAREALLAGAGEDGPTIAAVAAAHGFGHVGRFAADYRRVYAESPSQTLRRARGADDGAPEPQEPVRRAIAATPATS